MKIKLLSLVFSIFAVLGLLAVSGSASAYGKVCRVVPAHWSHGYWHLTREVCWSHAYQYRTANCVWKRGFWHNGYWYPQHKVCYYR